jgi:tRNA threonylcarbamoyl adenosine modification protein YeaZ
MKQNISTTEQIVPTVVLGLRTDSPEAEVVVCDLDGVLLKKRAWLSGRQLSKELLPTILATLESLGFSLANVSGIVVFTGTGSFTGLRIGTALANSLAWSLGVSCVSTQGDDWLGSGVGVIVENINDQPIWANVVYSSEAHITLPKN